MDNNNSSRESAENALTGFRKGMEAKVERASVLALAPNHPPRHIRSVSIGHRAVLPHFILAKDFAIVTGEMERMSVTLTNMEGNFTSVATDITGIWQTLYVLNDNVMVLPVISRTGREYG